MDELEKKPDAPQASAKKKPEQKNSFDNRKKLMYVLCGGSDGVSFFAHISDF